jgi:hypothetical protein
VDDLPVPLKRRSKPRSARRPHRCGSWLEDSPRAAGFPPRSGRTRHGKRDASEFSSWILRGIPSPWRHPKGSSDDVPSRSRGIPPPSDHPKSGERHPRSPSDDVPYSSDDAHSGECHATRPSNDSKRNEGYPEGGERLSKETSRGSPSSSDRSKRRECHTKDGERDAESLSGLSKTFSGDLNASSDDARSGERSTKCPMLSARRDASGPRELRRLAGERLQEEAHLVGVVLEGVDGGAQILVALGLVEAERGRVAGPGGEPEAIGSFRAGQGLGSGEELLADPLSQEGTLDVEAVELGCSKFRREALVGLIVSELGEADQVILDLGEEDGAPGLRQDLREGLFGEVLPDFPCDRGADAVGGVGVEKDLSRQDAEAERVRGDGGSVGGIAWSHTGL